MNKNIPVITEEREYQELLNSNVYYAVIIDPESNKIIDSGARTHELFNVDSSVLKDMHVYEFNKLLINYVRGTSCIDIDNESRVVLVDHKKNKGREDRVVISQSDYKLGDKLVKLLKISKSKIEHDEGFVDLNRILVESDDGLLVVNSNDLMEGKISFANDQALNILNCTFDEVYNSSLQSHIEKYHVDNFNTYRIVDNKTSSEVLLSIETLGLNIGSLEFQVVKLSKVRYVNLLDHIIAKKALSELIESAVEKPGYLIDIGFYFKEVNLEFAHHVLDTASSIVRRAFKAFDVSYNLVNLETDILVFTTTKIDIVLKALTKIVDNILIRNNRHNGSFIRGRFSVSKFSFLKQIELEDIFNLRNSFGESEYNTIKLDPQMRLDQNFIELRGELRSLLNFKQFKLYVQSIVNLGSKRVDGYEVLLRWEHERMGTILPGDFIGFAEANGWAYEIDLWVLESVFEFLAKNQLTDEFKIHINVSPSSFSSEGFTDAVCSLATQYAVRTSMIVIEVAENAYYEAPSDDLKKLRDSGFLLAVDDFGRGYASFQRLRENRYDYIKIDQNFIQNIESNVDAVMILSGIINLSNTLNINVIVEGVETYEQMLFAKDKQCQYVQGYLFDTPGPIENLAEDMLFIQERVQRYSQSNRYSEEHLRAETSPHGINIQLVDENLEVIVLCGMLANRLKYDAHEFASTSFMDLVAEEYRSMVAELFTNAKKGDLPPAVIVKLLSSDKTEVRCILLIEYDYFGNIYKIYIEFADYLDETEIELLGLSSTYLEAFNDAPVGIVLLSDDFRVLRWNRKCVSIFGFMPYEAENKNLVKLVSVDKQMLFMNKVLSDISGNESIDLILENTTKRNKKISCRWIIKHIQNMHENRNYYICTVSDITEALNKRKELTKLIKALDQSESMIIITDGDGNIEFVNDRYQEVTGIFKNEVLNSNWMSVVSGEQSHALGDEIFSKVSKGQEWKGEVHLRKSDRSYFWADVSVYSVNEEDQITGYVCLLKDITEEKDLMKANDQYRQKLADQEKVATLGYLTSGIMHEINNPLSYVQTNINYISTVLNSLEGNEIDVEDFKEAVNDSVTGLNQITEITKGMKRYLHNREQAEFSQVNVVEELNTVLLITRNEYKYHANVKFDFRNEVQYTVEGLASKLRQVFMNLIINAVHAIVDKHDSSLGTIRITIEKTSDKIIIQFNDDGKGIKPENMMTIFEPFFTTKAKDVGTGLGLSISKQIIEEEHKGKLYCDSVLGEGTTFTIELPIQMSDSE